MLDRSPENGSCSSTCGSGNASTTASIVHSPPNLEPCISDIPSIGTAICSTANAAQLAPKVSAHYSLNRMRKLLHHFHQPSEFRTNIVARNLNGPLRSFSLTVLSTIATVARRQLRIHQGGWKLLIDHGVDNDVPDALQSSNVGDRKLAFHQYERVQLRFFRVPPQ